MTTQQRAAGQGAAGQGAGRQRSGKRWQNWSRTVRIVPAQIRRAGTVGEVQQAVRDAAAAGIPVKAVGAGHSFSAIAEAPGMLLDLSALDGLLSVDRERGRATFAAGTNLFQVPALLEPHGLAMANLGDIDRQTLAGAVSTGTHGTGLAFGGIATQITGLSLVTADGGLLRIDEHENAELLPAARVGLGALGIIVEVTLQCVPAFLLHAVERPLPLDEVVDTLLERMRAEDHFEFHWFPGTGLASTKTNTRLPLDAPLHPRGRLGRWFDDRVMADTVFRSSCALGTRVGAVTPAVNRLAAATFANGEYTEPSHRVFVSSRGVRFREMEYAVPLQRLPEAFTAIRALIAEQRWRIEFPIEVRSAAADENWLSTAYGRDSGYIAVHRYWRQDHREFFAAAEELLAEFEGRPHWGKLHAQDAASLAARYPRFTDFTAVRDRLDPDHRFGNAELERVLGA